MRVALKRHRDNDHLNKAVRIEIPKTPVPAAAASSKRARAVEEDEDDE